MTRLAVLLCAFVFAAATSPAKAGPVVGVSWSHFQEERWKIDCTAMNSTSRTRTGTHMPPAHVCGPSTMCSSIRLNMPAQPGRSISIARAVDIHLDTSSSMMKHCAAKRTIFNTSREQYLDRQARQQAEPPHALRHPRKARLAPREPDRAHAHCRVHAHDSRQPARQPCARATCGCRQPANGGGSDANVGLLVFVQGG